LGGTAGSDFYFVAEDEACSVEAGGIGSSVEEISSFKAIR
jgi:hypothetical protein